jgi:hypothetical protein
MISPISIVHMPVLCIPCGERQPLPIRMARTGQKAGDGMESSENMIRVDKSECVRMIHRRKLQAIKLADIPPILNRQCVNRFKPSYPEELHTTSSIIQHPAPCVDNIHVIDSKDPCISILVNSTVVTGVSGKQHDVSAVRLRVDDVLRTPDVVRRVIDTQSVMLVHSIVLKV